MAKQMHRNIIIIETSFLDVVSDEHFNILFCVLVNAVTLSIEYLMEIRGMSNQMSPITSNSELAARRC